MDISIVFGTCNRFKLLKDCVESVRASVGGLKYEIIVADGGSTDGSREWLAAQGDVVLLGERHLDGAIIAYNKAFSLVRGWAAVHLNDDCVVIDDVLHQSYLYLREQASIIGQIAYHYDVALNGRFRSGDVIGDYQCANLGITQSWLGHRVGWWGDSGFKYGGDDELSMRIWQLGYKVVAPPQFRVHHIETHDELRTKCSGTQRSRDAHDFFARWEKPNFPTSPVIWETDANATIIRPW